MTRGQRQPDILSAQIDAMLDREVTRCKNDLLFQIKESPLFQQLIELSHGARHEDHEQLAHALLEAKLTHMPTQRLIEAYAQQFIYTHRVAPVVLFDKTPE